MAPTDYVAVANRKFSEVGRSVIPYASKSNGYFTGYNPTTAAYGNSQRSKYSNSALEYKCNNC